MIILRYRKSFFGTTTSRVVTQFPATIGRNPACDVWIDDPQVSALHAHLDREGPNYVLRNASTTNGLRVGRKRVDSLTFADRCSFYIGRMRIDAVARAESERTQEVDLRWRPRIGRGVVALVAMAVSSMLYAWLTPTEESSFAAAVIWFVLVNPLLIGGTAGILALWSKMQNGRYRYFEAFWMCAILAPLVTSLSVLSDTIEYNWPWRVTRDVIVPLLQTTMWGLVLAWVLRFVFFEHRFRNVATAVLAVLFLLLGGTEVAMYVDDTSTKYDFKGVVAYSLEERFDGGLDALRTAMSDSAERLSQTGAAKKFSREREQRRRDLSSKVGEHPDENEAPRP